MLKVNFHNPGYYPDCGLTYVIIGARHNNSWVFIKHKHRKGYELPAGHINTGEDADIAARRELTEETGAVTFKISCLATYTVSDQAGTRAGRLYYSEIEKFGAKRDDNEVEEIIFTDSLPENLSFPYIQKVLFDFLNFKTRGNTHG